MKKVKRDKEKIKNADEEAMSNHHHYIENDFDWDYSYLRLIPVFILLCLTCLVILGIVLLLFLLAAACFVIPIYLAWQTDQPVYLLVAVLSYMFGFIILKNLYDCFGGQ